MKRQHLVVTVTGSDRTGLVEEVTRTLVTNDGNVEAARMARLGGEFVMPMLVSVAAPQVGRIESAVRNLGRSDSPDRLEIHTRVTQGDAASIERRPACGLTVMGADHVAVDATCCRLMRILPERVDYLMRASQFLGNLSEERIDLRAERVAGRETDFRVIEEFSGLKPGLSASTG